jgi:pyrroline-5-carboxylate reductase
VSSLKELISFSDVVWLCVKPQVLAEVLEDMKGINLKEKVVVSVIAGKSIGFIE